MIIAFWIFTVLITGVIIFMIKGQKSENETEERLRKSLEDEFIIDPETGIKITLEEAESGHWISHDNEYKTISESEIENLLSNDEKQVAIAINYLKESRYFTRTILTEKQFEILDKTEILSKYDNWTFSDSFVFKNGILFFPAPKINGKTFYQEDYCESQLMFWLKIKDCNGHYYLREKTYIENFLDKFRPDDDLHLKNYESFTYKKSYDLITIQNILKRFENQKGLEIEINDDNLFIKTLVLMNIEDIKRLEKITSTLI